MNLVPFHDPAGVHLGDFPDTALVWVRRSSTPVVGPRWAEARQERQDRASTGGLDSLYLSPRCGK